MRVVTGPSSSNGFTIVGVILMESDPLDITINNSVWFTPETLYSLLYIWWTFDWEPITVPPAGNRKKLEVW